MNTDEAIAEARDMVDRNFTCEPCVVKELIAELDRQRIGGEQTVIEKDDAQRTLTNAKAYLALQVSRAETAEHALSESRNAERLARVQLDAVRRLLRGELAKEREMVAMLENAVRYLANECDPKCNGFYNEFPDLRALIETENTP